MRGSTWKIGWRDTPMTVGHWASLHLAKATCEEGGTMLRRCTIWTIWTIWTMGHPERGRYAPSKLLLFFLNPAVSDKQAQISDWKLHISNPRESRWNWPTSAGWVPMNSSREAAKVTVNWFNWLVGETVSRVLTRSILSEMFVEISCLSLTGVL